MTHTRLGALVAVMLALIVAAPAAVAAPARLDPSGHAAVRKTRRAVRCPKSRVRIRLGRQARGTEVCLTVARTPHGNEAAASVQVLDHLVRTARVRRASHRGGSLPKSWLGKLSRGLTHALTVTNALNGPSLPSGSSLGQSPDAPSHTARAGGAEPPARIAGVTPFHEEKAYSSDGWTGKAVLDGSRFEPDADQAGDFGVETNKQLLVHHKGDLARDLREHERIAIQACPTVQGEVPGTYEWSNTRTDSAPIASGMGTLIEFTQIKAKILGHTTDAGKLRDFDLDMIYQTHAQAVERDAKGRVVQTSAPQLWTIHLIRKGLHLGKAWDEVLDGTGSVQMPTVVGPGGSWTNAIPTDSVSIAQDAVRKLSLAALRADSAFRTLESAWGDGACFAVNFSSSDLSVSPHLDLNGNPSGGQVAAMKPGQVAHLTATITTSHGGALAPGRYTTELYRGSGGKPGTLSPTSGRFAKAPLSFTFTSPTDNWVKPDDPVSVYVTATSHQGSSLGVITLTPIPAGYRLVYTHSSAAGFSFPYSHYGAFDADGTFTEQQDLGLSATVPLTLDANQATATGSGALSWQAHTWTTDDDDDAISGQNASVRCEIETKQAVVGVQPGTVTVKSLSLGAAGANGLPTIKSFDVVLAGASETWHTDETQKAGPCPAENNPDETQSIFLNRLGNALYNLPGTTVTERGTSDGLLSVEIKYTGSWQSQSNAVTHQFTTVVHPEAYGDVAPAGAAIPFIDTFTLEPAQP
jgi:hypothetical protein